jgi:hypothetical protein|tara:strand:+ start:1246 stop:1431 length:186 start_codon:yes stop_codon:yes gene_type:complete
MPMNPSLILSSVLAFGDEHELSDGKKVTPAIPMAAVPRNRLRDNSFLVCFVILVDLLIVCY